MWKDIKGYEGMYQVNEYGEIKSLPRISCGEKICRRTSGGILKTSESGNGYKTVCLRDGKTTVRKYVHRVVAEHFLDTPSASNMVVNHKDGNKQNNHYSNLEWCTYSENNSHAYNNQLKPKGENFYNAKLSELEVQEILTNGKYATYQEIADKYNVTKATIRDILVGRTWKHIIK